MLDAGLSICDRQLLPFPAYVRDGRHFCLILEEEDGVCRGMRGRGSDLVVNRHILNVCVTRFQACNGNIASS